jgi:retron-type reverse transcriptase
MQTFLEHRIADRRMVRLLMKWLHAGVVENGELRDVQEGAPQGGGISPSMSNTTEEATSVALLGNPRARQLLWRAH